MCWNKSVSNWITTCFFIQTGNYSLDRINWSKLKYFNWKSSLKISPSIFSPPVKSHDYTEKSTRQRSSGTKVDGNAKTPSTQKTTEPKFYLQLRSNINPACARRNEDSFIRSQHWKLLSKTASSTSTKILWKKTLLSNVEGLAINMKTKYEIIKCIEKEYSVM